MRVRAKAGWLPFPFLLLTSLLIIGPVGYARSNPGAPPLQLQVIYLAVAALCLGLLIGIFYALSRVCEYRNGVLTYATWFKQAAYPIAEITDISYAVESYASNDSAPYSSRLFLIHQRDRTLVRLGRDFWDENDLRVLLESMRRDNPELMLDREVRQFLGLA